MIEDDPSFSLSPSQPRHHLPGSIATSSTKHHSQSSPGSNDWMIGWPLAWKCLVACLFFEESQQPTWPQMRQSRRCTQLSPLCRHSSQPLGVFGVTSRIWSRCVHGTLILFPSIRAGHVLAVPIRRCCNLRILLLLSGRLVSSGLLNLMT